MINRIDLAQSRDFIIYLKCLCARNDIAEKIANLELSNNYLPTKNAGVFMIGSYAILNEFINAWSRTRHSQIK